MGADGIIEKTNAGLYFYRPYFIMNEIRYGKGSVVMVIRKAERKDIEGIGRLLLQVCMVHHRGRPDLFRAGGRKYTDEELALLLQDEERPIFVAVDEKDQVLGYSFCIFQNHAGDTALTDIRTLYIDDLCVDENMRGQHIGKEIYEYVLGFAREQGCYNLTLNVWYENKDAMKFYEKCGLKPQKIGMETILSEIS